MNLEKEVMVKVLSVSDVGLGEEPVKGSLEAFFPCSITWCYKDIDTHIAEASPRLQHTDNVYINTYSMNDITPGLYAKITTYNNRLLLEKITV